MRKLQFLALLLILFNPLFAQSINDDLREIDSLAQNDMFDRAIEKIEEAKERWPDSDKIYLRAANLYKSEELYSLALREFLAAAEIDRKVKTLYEISRVHGILDNNEESILFLEEILTRGDTYYRDDAIDDLGWMYFKTNHLEEGENLMLSELEIKFDRYLAHTLGTIYSAMYEYDLSREYYLLAIDDALKSGASSFAAVGYYNLSLVEYSFYNYAKALEYTEKSLQQRDRANGHISKGELFQTALRGADALEEFKTAEASDLTLFSKIDLAFLYLQMGMLEEAEIYVRNILDDKDRTWMFNYGIDDEELDRDMAELQAELYSAKYNQAKVTPYWGVRGFIDKNWTFIKNRSKSIYWSIRYRQLSRFIGDRRIEQGGAVVDVWRDYSNALEGYRIPYLRYITQVDQFETSLTDRAIPFYAMKRGKAISDVELLNSSIEGFNPEWERLFREEGQLALISSLKGRHNKDLRDQILFDIYSVNSGGLRQNGLAIPLAIQISGRSGLFNFMKGKIRRGLKRAGHELVRIENATNEPKLIIKFESYGFKWFLQDSGGKPLAEGYSDGSYESLNQQFELIESSIYQVTEFWD